MNKQTLISISFALIIGVAIGYSLIKTDDNSGTNKPSTEKQVSYWVAPMDPNFRRAEPGQSPMGMDLIPVYEGGGDNDTGITVNPNVVANLGVKISKAEMTAFSTIIEATGRMHYDETKTQRIHVRSEGWVEKLVVRAVGDNVSKGDLLFTLYSPVIASALSEYGQALNAGSNRLQSLTLGKLKALGLDDRTIKATKKSKNWSAPISIYAPMSGVVTKLGVREGSLAAKNTVAFEITNPSTMWLIADVFESQASEVFIGQVAEITGENFHTVAKVDYIYPELDARLQTVRVRISLPNNDNTMKAGHYQTIRIRTEPVELLTVPSSAVIRLGETNRVIVAHNEGNFQAAEVMIGASSKGRTVITQGLSDGEGVVVSGQFMLDSESSFSGATLRMAGMKTADTMEMEMSEKPELFQTEATVVGTINSIEVDDRRVNITHPEIPEIGWPVMTMDFDVVGETDLMSITAPTKVQFTLGKNADGTYVVTSIKMMEAM